MDFINENENLYRTPHTNLKNSKRAAFSSVKNKAKKVLTDVVNTIDKRQSQFENAAVASKSFLSIEEIRESYKSPERVARETVELSKNEYNDDYFFTSCRCSSDVNELENFYELPEELRLSKEEINIFATRWRNDVEIYEGDIFASSPVKADPKIFREFVPDFVEESESFVDLLNESFEVIPPEIPF